MQTFLQSTGEGYKNWFVLYSNKTCLISCEVNFLIGWKIFKWICCRFCFKSFSNTFCLSSSMKLVCGIEPSLSFSDRLLRCEHIIGLSHIGRHGGVWLRDMGGAAIHWEPIPGFSCSMPFKVLLDVKQVQNWNFLWRPG